MPTTAESVGVVVGVVTKRMIVRSAFTCHTSSSSYSAMQRSRSSFVRPRESTFGRISDTLTAGSRLARACSRMIWYTTDTGSTLFFAPSASPSAAS